MKKSVFRAVLYSAVLGGGLLFGSCKDNKDADAEMEIENNEGDMVPEPGTEIGAETDTTLINPDTVMGP